MAPVILPANQPPARPYKGGPSIFKFRNGDASSDPWTPEDWIASTTCCHGCESSKLGMTKLPDGRYLADAVAEQPEYWLGSEHIKAWGVDTKVLVKLLDAGQRLFVHVHPHADWAKKYVGATHGKAEAWFILSPGEVFLGLKDDVSHEKLLEMVERQEPNELLGHLHRLKVQAFDTVYVPPGTPHATGEGVFLVEVQEPGDLSVLCEWKGWPIDGATHGHLGLGFDTALTAVDRTVYSNDAIEKLVVRKDTYGSTMTADGKVYFDMERVQVDGQAQCEAGFAVMIVFEGSLEYTAERGGSAVKLAKGSTVVVPHDDGVFTLKGRGECVLIRPPK